MSVIQISSFNPALLTISEAKPLENGSKQAYLNYNGKRLRIQAPKMPVPMDAGDYQGNQKYKVQLSFRDKENTAKVAAYYNVLEQIDNFVINHAMANSGPWFKKPGMARPIVADKFTPSIKFAKDKEGNLKPYPPTHGLALKKNKAGAFDAELYDKEKRLIEGMTPVEVLKRGSEITPVVECSSVWITEKGFGLTWKLFQARVDVGAEGIEPGCAIVDDEDISHPTVTPAAHAATTDMSADDEDDVLAAVVPAKTVSKPAPAPAPVVADDEDDDNVVQAVPVPVKPAVKKPAVKKPVVAK